MRTINGNNWLSPLLPLEEIVDPKIETTQDYLKPITDDFDLIFVMDFDHIDRALYNSDW